MLKFEKDFLQNQVGLFSKLNSLENRLNCNTNKVENIVIGVDEVGRGCLAGPVVAAAVAIDLNYNFTDLKVPTIRDSKTLSKVQRAKAKDFIENSFICNIAFIDNKRIDDVNILNASLESMSLACKGLELKQKNILTTFVDGNKLPSLPNAFKATSLIKGDSKSFVVACASIIAKEARDSFMQSLAKKYPHYGFENNKGYGTKEHKNAIAKHGFTSFHRMSFKVSL